MERYIAVVLTRRWLIVLVAGPIMLAMTAGVQYITITNDYRSLFEDDNPQLLAFDALENTYSASNLALIAVAPGQGSVFTREALGAIEELSEAAWGAPHSIRVDSLTNYSHSEAFEDDLIVEPLVIGAQDLSDDELAQVEAVALNSPDLAGRLVAYDGQVGGVAITFALPDNPDEAVVEITDYLNGVLAEARAEHPALAYYLTGDVVLNRAFSDATKNDLVTFAPIVLLVIVVVTVALLRSALGTLAIIGVLGFIINTTMGFAGWIGTVLNPANSGVAIIVMTIAIAHSVHIVTAVLSGLRRGLSKEEAIAASLRSNAYPVLLTTVTTAIGFLSLNSSDSPAFHVLGNLVAFGVVCAFIYSMTLLPAVLCILPLRARSARSRQAEFFERFGAFVVARRRYLFLVMCLVVAVLAAGIPRIELTDNWTRYLDDRYEFRRNTDFVIENLTGMETLEYSLKSGGEGGITDPEYMSKVEAFAEWYRDQPEVTHVQAFPDIMKRLNKNMHGDDPEFYRLPDDPELAAQYLLLYELSLPFGSDLNNRIDVAKSATRLTVVLRSLSAREQRELDARAQAWLGSNAPSLLTEASGVSIVFANLSQRNIDSMLVGTLIAMGLISLILLLVFRNVRLGLLSLIPNLIPLVMSFGLWGYLVGRVGLAASVVAAMAFGIIVDDTIHFLSKYMKARREGKSPSEAVRYTFRIVGQALWTTTAVLSAGFLVFASSGFEVSWSLGLLVTLTIVLALLADFLLLPPLLMLIDRKKP